jgi:hypothetical protein
VRAVRPRLVAGLAGGALLLAPALAFGVFTTQATNPQTATADSIVNWLHQYSQATDPVGLTGYATRRGCGTTLAATGSGQTLVVATGGVGITSILPVTLDRAWTIAAPASYPGGQANVTTTVSLGTDPTTGAQPVSNVTLGSGGLLGGLIGGLLSLLLAPAVKQDVNLTINTAGLTASHLYVPTVKIIISFAGESSGFLEYTVPVSVWTGTGSTGC